MKSTKEGMGVAAQVGSSGCLCASSFFSLDVVCLLVQDLPRLPAACRAAVTLQFGSLPWDLVAFSKPGVFQKSISKETPWKRRAERGLGF